jgi:hypothetical protein
VDTNVGHLKERAQSLSLEDDATTERLRLGTEGLQAAARIGTVPIKHRLGSVLPLESGPNVICKRWQRWH